MHGQALVSMETAVENGATSAMFLEADEAKGPAVEFLAGQHSWIRGASAPFAIARSDAIAVAGNSRRRQQLALSRRSISLREAVLFTSQLVAEAELERIVVEQQAKLAAQEVQLANAKAALSVLKEQEAQIIQRRKAVGQPAMQVRRSAQRLHAVPVTVQNAPDASLAAQLAADRAAAELIAEEQIAAIRHQQACIRAAHTRAKKQELRQNSQERSEHHHTIHNKGAKDVATSQAYTPALTHLVNIDTMVSGLAHDTTLQQQTHDNAAVCMRLQSADLHQSQDRPQTDVSASSLDTMHHIGNNAIRRLDRESHRGRQADCLDSSDPRHTDEQLMLKMLCCPITKMTLEDPVIAADGHTYERTAMEHWMQQTHTSPVTGDILPHRRLLPNVVIKSMVAAQSC